MNANEIKEIYAKNRCTCDFGAFRTGIECYLKEQALKKVLLEKRKSGKFVIDDYVTNRTDYKTDERRSFVYGVYHDGGKKVVTDGTYLVMVHDDYPPEYEGKIMNGTNEIECQFPNYAKVIPEDLEPCDYFTLDDLKICSSISKSRSDSKLSLIYVGMGKVKISLKILKKVLMFWESMNLMGDVGLYKSKGKIENLVVKDSQDNMIVFCPLSADADCEYTYLREEKTYFRNQKQD